MPDLSGEIGGLTMVSGIGDYHMIGDCWVSESLLWSSEPGVVVQAMGQYGITVHGFVAMSGVKFSSGQAVPAVGDWRGIVMVYRPENVFIGNQVRHAIVAVEVVGYGPRGGVQDNFIRDCPGIGLFVCGYDEEALHSGNEIWSCGSGMFVDYRGF